MNIGCVFLKTKPELKGYVLYKSIHMTSGKCKANKMENRSVGYPGGREKEEWLTTKGAHRGIFKAMELLYMVLRCWMCDTMHLLKATELQLI